MNRSLEKLQTEGQTEGQTDRRMDGQMDGRTEKGETIGPPERRSKNINIKKICTRLIFAKPHVRKKAFFEHFLFSHTTINMSFLSSPIA